MVRNYITFSLIIYLFQITIYAAKKLPVRPDIQKGENIIFISKDMVLNENPNADPWLLFDNPKQVPDYSPWVSKDIKSYPISCHVDLGKERMVSQIAIYPLNGVGNWDVYYGTPDAWKKAFTLTTVGHKFWKNYSLGVKTRYLKFVLSKPGANIGELAIIEKPKAKYTDIPVSVLEAQRKAEAERRSREAAQKIIDYAKTLPKTADAGPVFGMLPLIDEVDMSNPNTPHLVKEVKKGDSELKEILGKTCRVLPKRDRPTYFGYRMGQGLGLQAGKAYLVAVDYPEDVSRTIWVQNFGAEMNQGFATGQALGDSIFTYTNNNLESLKYPLSQKYNTWYSMFYLHDKTSDSKIDDKRTLRPKDGFTVLFSQPTQENQPIAAGTAISRIRLFEVPNPEQYYQKINFPPEELPHRYVYYREEMGFKTINHRDINIRGVDNVEDWFEYKMRLQKFLGMNVFLKTMLTFGAPQGWDVDEGKKGLGWYRHHKFPKLHQNLLPLTKEYGLEYFGYYEYSAGQGPGSLGAERRLQPLGDKKQYTHVGWAERIGANLTDPDTLADAKRLLDYTILRHKGKADFMGVVFRTRVSKMPISFTDADIERFIADEKIAPCECCGASGVNRKKLKKDPELYQRYRSWWNHKRLNFVEGLRQHLIDNGIEEPQVLFSSFHTEPGPSLLVTEEGKGMVLATDDPETWNKLLANQKKYEKVQIMDIHEVIEKNMYKESLIADRATWGDWEWQHADPAADPQNYQSAKVTQTMPFNRYYTVANPDNMELFTSQKGQALIRRLPLNEYTLGKYDKSIVGYLCLDVERSGANSMFGEANAMANGNPTHLGYFSGQTFNRGFPQYVRKFNAAFLSLPALPATLVKGATSDSKVVMKEIKTENHGTYYAVVNTSFSPISQVKITFPASGKITNAATGQDTGVNDNNLTLDFIASELKAFRIQ